MAFVLFLAGGHWNPVTIQVGFSQASADDVQYTYDELGRLVEAANVSTSQATEYTYDAAGNISSNRTLSFGTLSFVAITPSKGGVGSQVSIFGTGFGTSTANVDVRFNGVTATVSTVSATKIVTTVPQGATTGPVSITTAAGSVSGFFTVTSIGAPTITGVSPTTGGYGQAVTISGSNFETDASLDQVFFNGSRANVSTASATTLVAEVPTYSTSGKIRVTTRGGTAVSPGDFFVAPGGSSSLGGTGRIVADGSDNSISVSDPSKIILQVFEGAQGQYLTLGIVANTLSNAGYSSSNPIITVLTPNGSRLVYARIDGGVPAIQLPRLPTTGTYTISIDPNGSTGNLTFRVVPPFLGSMSIDGAPLSIGLSPAGQRALITFSGMANSGVTLNIGSNNVPNCAISILDPNGTPVGSASLTASGTTLQPVLTLTGTYTILIDPVGAVAGGMVLQLASTSVTFATGSGRDVNFVDGNAIQFAFNGDQGQNLALIVSENASGVSSASISVLTPSGATLSSGTFTGSGSAGNYSGKLVMNLPALPDTGTYTIVAQRTGGANGRLSFALLDRAKTISLASSSNPSGVGQPITFSALVTGDSGTPTGTITFKDGATTLGSVSLSSGSAVYSTSALSQGSHNITAVYGGDSNNSAVTSSVLTQVVNSAWSTATTLVSSANPSAPGSAITLTSKVTGNNPTGSVNFLDGGSSIGTTTLSGGVATLSTSSLAAGTHKLTASYAGSGGNGPSVSEPLFQSVRNSTSIAWTAGFAPPASVRVSTALDVEVTVTGTGLTGPVTFYDTGTQIAATTLIGDTSPSVRVKARLPMTRAGNRTITVQYAGDTANAAATLTTPITVNQANPTVAWGSDFSGYGPPPASVVVNQTLQQEIRVVGAGPTVGSTAPSGLVQVFDGATQLASGTLQTANMGGTAIAYVMLDFAMPAIGARTITVQYQGDANNAPASFNTAINVTDKAAPTLSWGTFVNCSNGQPALLPPSTMTVNQTICVDLQVTGAGATYGNNQPTGTITFMDGATQVGTATLQNGIASGSTFAYANAALTLSTVGSPRTLSAQYSGDTRNTAGAVTASINVTDKVSPTIAWTTAPPGNIVVGQTFPVSVQLSGAGALYGSNLVTGTVTFLDGATVLAGPLTLSGSAVSANLAMGTAGTRNIVVQYNGDSRNSSTNISTPITVAPKTTPVLSWTAGQAPPSAITVAQLMNVQVRLSGGTGQTQGSNAPGGTVSVLDGATVLASSIPVVGFSGQYSYANLSFAMPTAGSRTITVQYSGDGSNNTSSFNTSITVNAKATPTVTWVSAPPASVAINQTMNLTVQVSGAGPVYPGTAATGTVTISDSGTQLGTGTLVNGQVTIGFAMRTAGARTITVQYNGDPCNVAATLNTSINVTKTAPIFAWSGTPPASVVVNQTIANVQIRLTGAGPTYPNTNVTGTVTVYDGAAVLVSATALNNSGNQYGYATVSFAMPTAGSRQITVQYSGDASNNAASFDTPITVNAKVTPTLAWNGPPPASVVVNQSMSVSVYVDGAGTNSGSQNHMATGTVTFKDGATTLATANLSNIWNGANYVGYGTATISLATAGSRTITVQYNGDNSNNAASFDTPITVNAKVTPTLAWNGPPPASVVVNQSMSVSVYVDGAGTNFGSQNHMATGTVTFKDGATTLATANLSNIWNGANYVGYGTATISLATAGSRTITVQYNGDNSNNAASFDTPITVNAKVTPTLTWNGLPPASVVVNQSMSVSVYVDGAGTNFGSQNHMATGTVTFKDGATTLATANLSNIWNGANYVGYGTATISLATAGSRTITVQYNGDNSNNAASFDTPITVNAKVTPTLAWNVPPPASAVVNQSMSVSVYVDGAGSAVGSHMATGTVTFKDGATTLATANLSNIWNGANYVGYGTATISLATAGSRTITVQYNGDNSNNAASFGTTITVYNTTNATVAWSTAPPASAGINQTISAQVKVTGVGSGSGSTAPTGTVRIFDGATALTSAATLTASGNQYSYANVNFAMPTAGSRTITATYSGDANNNTQNLNTPITVTAPASPTFTWGMSPPASVGVNQTFSAVVWVIGNGASYGTAAATGTVTAFDGSTPISSAVSLNTSDSRFGSGALNISMPTSGSRTITVQYSGDSTNSPGSFNTSITVNDKTTPTVTWITTPPSSAVVNQTFNVAVRVTGVGATAGSTIATGTVTFLDGATTLAGPVSLSGGTATVGLSDSALGARTITVQYNGDSRNLAGTLTGAVTINDKVVPTVTWITPPPSSSVVSQSFTVKAGVSGAGPSAGSTVPTGAVTFLDNGTAVAGPITLSSGSATATVAMPSSGIRTLTAQYNGDPSNLSGSINSSVTVNNKSTPTLSWVTAPPASTKVNQSFSVRLQVAGAGPTVGNTAATGAVTFVDAGTTLAGPVALSAGQTTTISLTMANAGSRTITAQYSGDSANVSANLDTPITVTNSGISASPSSVTFGNQPVNTTSSPQTVTVSNTGSTNLTISTTSLSGTAPSNYSVTANTCAGAVVPPSQSCSLNISFTPSTTGARSATLQVASDAQGGTLTVTLNGTGVVPTANLTPASFGFGAQLIGTTSSATTFNLSNTGTSNLNISSIGLTGAHPTDFSVSNGCPSALPPSQACNIGVTFGPSASGARTATLQVLSDASNGTRTASLTGTGLRPLASVSPSSLSFGNQAVQLPSAAQNVTVTNTGNSTLTVTGASLTGANSTDFAISSNGCGTVAVNGSCTIGIKFNPLATGARTASLQIASDAGNGTQTVTLSGTGTAPVAAISPSALTFSDQRVGTTSSAQTVTFTNTGSGSVTVTGFSGPNQGDFLVPRNGCTSALSANQSCTFDVTFSPIAPGNRSGTLQVDTNPTSASQSVALSGQGTAASVAVNPSTLAFGSQAVGTLSAIQSVTISNPGTSDLTINGLSLQGSNAGDYAVATNGCGAPVPAGQSCIVGLKFAPTATGARSAVLVIASNAYNGTQSVAVSGTGTQPAIALAPGSLTFGSQVVGVASSAQVITVSNTGSSSLAVSMAQVSGANSGDFSISSNTCTTPVPAGQSCSLGVRMTAGAVGSRTAVLVVTSDAANGTQNVSLSGTGVTPVASVSPGSLAYGSQMLNTTSAARTVTVTNTGTSNLTVSGVTLAGTNAADYSVAGNGCTSGVAPSGSCAITVTFRPTAQGTRTASLQIASDASNGAQSVTLSGTGIAAVASVSPSSLTFGNQLLNTTSASQAITVSNTGNSSMAVSGVTLAGTNPGDFTIVSNGCSAPVASGGSCVITAAFRPTTTGARGASVQIASNANNGTQSVALAGTGVTPTASVSPSSLSYGNQLRNTTSSAQAVTVTNSGTSNLTVSGVTLTGTNSADYNVASNGCATVVAPSNSCTVTVTFRPTALGVRTASLQIASDASNGTQSVALSGTGVTPTASVSPSSLTYGNQLLNTTSAAQTVTVTNSGTSSLTVSGVTLTGTNAGDYNVASNGCATAVAPSNSCTVTVTFRPTALGVRTALLQIASDASNGTQSVALSGTGVTPTASVSPSSLTYGNQLLNTTSTAQTVTVTNSGTSNLTVSGVTLTGTNSTDYSVASNGCTSGVAPSGSCAITVTFRPTAQGTRTASLQIASDASNGSQSVTLSGTGIAAVVNVSPSSLTFGNQLLNTTSAAQTVTVTNSGTSNLTVSGVTLTGMNSADYNVASNGCATAVAPNNSCAITVTFRPAALGARTASLQIASNANNGTQMVGLSGTGVTPTASVSPLSLSYGNQLLSTTSSAQGVTVTNSGTSNLTVSGVTLSGTNSADYNVASNGCASPVAPSNSCTVTVTFRPTALGVRTASLQIASDASNGTQSVGLSGTGVTPTASVAPSSLSYGNQLLSTTSSAQTVTVTNSGTSNLTVSGVTLTGTNAADYNVASNGCTSPVAPSSSCAIAVTFRPAALGARTASLQITSDASNGTQSVALSGTGVTPTASVSPSSLSYGNQLLNTTSAAQTVTLTNTGTSNLTVSGVVVTGTNSADYNVASNGCTTAVAPSSSCSITVTFRPTAQGARTASLQISSDASNGVQSVSVSGTGTAPTATAAPASLSFGDQAVNTLVNDTLIINSTSAPKTVTVTNTGTSALHVSSVSLLGTNPQDFAISNNGCTAAVAPSANCTVSVTFSPLYTGTRSATLRVNSDASNGARNVSLTGNGTGHCVKQSGEVICVGQ